MTMQKTITGHMVIAGAVTLALALGHASAANLNLEWDSDLNGANNPGTLGAGGLDETWDTLVTTSNWWDSDAALPLDMAWDNSGDHAYFSGTAGTVTIDNGSVIRAASLTFNVDGYSINGATNVDRLNVSGAINVVGGATATINTGITGTNGLTKADTGTLVLTATSNYFGVTNVNQGIVSIEDSGALGTLFAGNGTVVADGATLRLDGVFPGLEPLTLNGSGFGGIGALQSVNANNGWLDDVVLNNATIGVDAGNTLSMNGQLSGDGVTKIGPGTIALSGNNTYNGPTNINEGTLTSSGNDALGTSNSNVTVADGATLNALFSNTIGTLDVSGTGVGGNGALTGGGTLTATGNMTFNLGATSPNFTGTINAQADADIDGDLTVGNSSYNANGGITDVGGSITGKVNVNSGGTLIVNAGGSITGDVDVNGTSTARVAGIVTAEVGVNDTALLDLVNGTIVGDVFLNGAGSTLSGNGQIAGTTQMVAGSIISPGSPGSVGTIQIEILAMQLASIAPVDVGPLGTSDLVEIDQLLTFDGAIIQPNAVGPLAAGDVYTLFTVAAGGTLIGNPTLDILMLPPGAYALEIIPVGSGPGGTGQVNLNIIPAPAALPAGLILLGLAGWKRGRRGGGRRGYRITENDS